MTRPHKCSCDFGLAQWDHQWQSIWILSQKTRLYEKLDLLNYQAHWSFEIFRNQRLVTFCILSIDKTKVMCLLLHSADVAHPTKEWSLHKEWTARCMEEFFSQGDREKEMGLDVSPLCDRNSTQIPQSQIGFIDYIIVPLFSTVNDLLNLLPGVTKSLILSSESPKSQV